MAFYRIRDPRNTVGYTTTATVGLTGSHTAVRPRLGKLQIGAGLPHAPTLDPRVDNFQNAGLSVEKAKEYIDQCKVKAAHHPGPLNARTHGRSRQFFTAIFNGVGKTVGIGRGSAPDVATEWGRPDRPIPVKLTTGKSRLHNAVFGVSKGEAALRREAEASVSQKKTVLMSESKVDLRKAIDRETALTNKAAQLGGVQQIMRDAMVNAQATHETLVHQHTAATQTYDERTVLVGQAFDRVSVLENADAVMRTQANDLNNAIRVNRSTHDALTEQAAVLDVLLEVLPAPPAQRPAVFGPSRAELVTWRERAATNLGKVEQRLPRLERALVGAQANLDAKSQEVVAAPQDSRQRARLLAELRVCLDVRDQARVQLRRGQRWARELPVQVQVCKEKIKRLDEHSQHQRYDQLSSERTLIGLRLNDLAAQRQDLMARIRPLRADLRANQLELTEARRMHEIDRDAQFSANLEVQRAYNKWQVSLQELEGLRAENERLQPIADELSVPLTDAVIEASVLRAQEEIRLENKLQELVLAPPGFEPEQLTPQLRAQMGQLAQRLKDVPEGLTDEQATTLRRERIPIDQALEIISRSLSLATKGKGADAQVALTWLMDRSFADLVPLPGTNFSGERESKGDDLNEKSAQKRTASLLAACPSGGELLKRLVQPGAEPPRQLQDAVAVYFRATNAVPDTPDVPSKDRLHCAEHAAKVLAHPQGQRELTREQRVSFNAVRNGFTSFAKGSPYETANAAIEKLADHWMPRGQVGANKTSPLHARQRLLAANVAADLGFPTLETKLNARLKDACDELQKIIAREVVEARTRLSLVRGSHQAGSPEPRVPDALLAAQSTLHYIRERADLGQRIDTIRLDDSAWRAINKEAARQESSELAVGFPVDERVSSLELRRLATGLSKSQAEGLGEQPEFDSLQNALWVMQIDKPTALEALAGLRDQLTRSGTGTGMSGLSGASLTDAQQAAQNSADDLVDRRAAGLNRLGAVDESDRNRLGADGVRANLRPAGRGGHANPSVQQQAIPDGEDGEHGLNGPDDPRPRTRLDEALSDAAAMQAKIDCFTSNKGKFSPEALVQWMTPALVTPTDGPDFGSVTFSQGRQRGLGTGGLVGYATQVASLLGLVIRPELDGTRGRTDQFRFGRDGFGVGMSMGRTRGGGVSLGGSAALVRPFAGPNNALAGGLPGASLIHNWATTNLQGGAVIRVPKFDGKTPAQQGIELGEVLSTALTWRKPIKDDGEPPYDTALEALLDQHPSISVTTFDNARSFVHTASANLVGFLGLAGPVGNAGGFGSVAAGVTSSNTQETRTSKHTGGTQSLQVKAKVASHKWGVTAGAFGRLGYLNPADTRVAGVRVKLLGLTASADLRLSSARSAYILVRQPDGSIVGQRSVEYTSYEKFEAAVNLHRDKWIQEGIRFAAWPEDFPQTDRRIVAERAFHDFMVKAKASLQAGTVTLNETMDIKPEVAAQLNANLALEELARLGERHEDALALEAAREEILAQDSSWQPFFLLPHARSSISGSTGLDFGVIATETHGAQATRLYDYFPRMKTPAL